MSTTYSFTVKATDANGLTATLADSIAVSDNPYLIVGSQALSTSRKSDPDMIINTTAIAENFKQGAIAGDVMIATCGNGYFTSSDEGATWSVLNSYPTGANFSAVAYSPTLGRIVISGARSINYSDNGGSTWTEVEYNPSPNPTQDVLSIVWADALNAFFMFGGSSPFTVYRSADATSWSTVYMPGGTLRGRLSWLPNNQLLALGQQNGLVGFSSNGTDWSTSSVGTTATIFRVAENASTIMAIYAPSSAYQAKTSADGGSTWSSENPTGLSNVEDLWAFGNKWVIAQGTNRHLSADGVTWTPATTVALSRFFSRE